MRNGAPSLTRSSTERSVLVYCRSLLRLEKNKAKFEEAGTHAGLSEVWPKSWSLANITSPNSIVVNHHYPWTSSFLR